MFCQRDGSGGTASLATFICSPIPQLITINLVLQTKVLALAFQLVSRVEGNSTLLLLFMQVTLADQIPDNQVSCGIFT